MAAAVPPDVLVSLREAFAREVGTRIPVLEDRADDEETRRAAHTLASGAWVVGEPEIARLARSVENDLESGPVDELLVLLRGYVA